MRAKSIMVVGTMSSAGKSVVTAGLCRMFHQDGYRVAPFKSQNMALNSYITKDGLEMGRAQVMQAEAAGIAPDIRMNPILLKPTSEAGSQVIVNGKVYDNLRAKEYYQRKQELIPEIRTAYESLAEEYDIVVLEGAGSPAEINLRDVDIVNMGMAAISDSPVIVVGDIDRGGVFASLYGTIALLRPEERRRIQGIIINKFRGDISILESGLTMLEELTGVPVLGVLPYLPLHLEEEDSLAEQLSVQTTDGTGLDIAVIRLPRIANFTDFAALSGIDGVSVRYVTRRAELGTPDLLILPGTKNTLSDLRWLRESGLEAAILKLHEKGCLLFGICGGFQMLGKQVSDPDQTEGGGSLRGMGLLDMETIFQPQKHQQQVQGTIAEPSGVFAPLAGSAITGYEIHMGRSIAGSHAIPFTRRADGTLNGYCNEAGTVSGTYLHGFFDTAETTAALLQLLRKQTGRAEELSPVRDFQQEKERQYNQLADAIREHLDTKKIYQMCSSCSSGIGALADDWNLSGANCIHTAIGQAAFPCGRTAGSPDLRHSERCW